MNLPAHGADLTPISPSDDEVIVDLNYEALPADDAREMRAIAIRMRTRIEESIRENGIDLNNAKERLKGIPRAFGAFLRGLDISERTAQNWMSAARRYGDRPDMYAALPPGTLYVLAAPSTPKAIQADVERQIEEGKRPEPAAVLETIIRAKRVESERRETERKAKGQADRRGRQGKLSPEAQAEWDRKRENRAKISKRQEAKAEAERKRVDIAAEEIALTIADRLGDDLAGVLASSEGNRVWSKVRDVLVTLNARQSAPETAAQLDAA